MNEKLDSLMMSKRQFMKCCLLATGGCMLGLDRLSSVAKVLDTNFGSPFPSGDLWKWSKEASFYLKTDGGLLCQKCPHGCVLQDNDVGKCRNRVNYQGKMYTHCVRKSMRRPYRPYREEAVVPLLAVDTGILNCCCRMQPSMPELPELADITIQSERD